MDSWLDADSRPKVPEKSLVAPWLTEVTMKSQVSDLMTYAGTVKVKYKETSRGGLAVNVIEC